MLTPSVNSSAAQPMLTFRPALRIHQALTASIEKCVLHWLAARMPAWVSSDQLTLLGLVAQLAAGAAYALARYHRGALIAVSLCMVANWFGDSLDGTLARVRNHQRPRYGFYVDHMVDVAGAVAMMYGLALSGFVHPGIAIAMLLAFLVLACESYLATYTLGRFELSQGLFGPTEIRLLLIAGNVALLRSPYSHVFGHKVLLFDLGGAIATVCMVAMAIVLTMRHTAQLYREEPLP
jgi:archaetidylinositol phosphate synthase